MRNKLLLCAAGVLLAIPAHAQNQGLLDVLVFKVKPEKREAFDGVMKRVADANRRNGGDIWMTLGTEYGTQNTFTMLSPRENFAGIDTAYESFEKAIQKAFGHDGMQKMMTELNTSLESSRGEVRRRRWDLSVHPPGNREEYVQTIGKARWLRSSMVQIRPGRKFDYEAAVAQVKDAAVKADMAQAVWVSEVMAGGEGSTYYVTTFAQKLGDFDEFPAMPKILGKEGFRAYMRAVSDLVVNSSTEILRVLPAMSSIPKDVAAVSPEFWTPKPPVAAVKQKPKAEAPKQPCARRKFCKTHPRSR